DAFRAELPRLLGPRGRLLLARLRVDPARVGSLRPVDGTTAEIQRLYLRPPARGLGLGRALLARLLREAGPERSATVRLETARSMTTAHAMYRASGFVDRPPFDGSEVAGTPLDPHTIFMELRL